MLLWKQELEYNSSLTVFWWRLYIAFDYDICTKHQLEVKEIILVLIRTLNYFKFVFQAVNLPLPLKTIIGGNKNIDIIHFICLMTHSISNKHVSYVSLFDFLVRYGSHGNIRNRTNEKITNSRVFCC